MGSKKQVVVLGAGSWGTALAHHLTRAGAVKTNSEVTIWGLNQQVLAEITNRQSNSKYFPQDKLAHGIKSTTDLALALAAPDLVVLAVPSDAVRKVAQAIKKQGILSETIVVSCVKGLEDTSLKRMTTVLTEELGNINRIAVLSGPSFAIELLRGFPTAVTIAASDLAIVEQAANFFHFENFRVYQSTDVIGTEIGGAVKNVIAIAVGVVDGVGLGLNARAALITRGLAEIGRLITSLGGNPLSINGLSCLGDLLLTATGDLSRNRQVGLRLGKGEKLSEILKSINQVVEGVSTTHKVFQLGQKYQVELPIINELHHLLSGKSTVNDSVTRLLSRAPTIEA